MLSHSSVVVTVFPDSGVVQEVREELWPTFQVWVLAAASIAIAFWALRALTAR